MVRSSAADDHGDNSSHGGGSTPEDDQQIGPETTRHNQDSLLIDATCIPMDIRYPTNLSLLKGTSKKSASPLPPGAGLPQGQVEVPQMELKNADRPGWAQMTTGLPMNRRPDPQLPQDFWSAL
ncbi:MAG: hypothetical protein ACK6AD_08340, partial [Cyanobacteriota bacterium]